MMRHDASIRRNSNKLLVLVLAIITLAVIAVFSVNQARAQTETPVPAEEGEQPASPVALLKPAEGQVIALNGGGPENAYPVTWTRVEGALFYYIEIYSPPLLLKDSDQVLEEASKLEYTYNPDDSEAYLLLDPVLQLDVGQLNPRLWHQIVITAYGPTDRFLQEYPDFRNQPTDLGINSGYYQPLGAPSAPRNFFLAIADNDPADPATPPLEDFPTYEDIVAAAPTPDPLPTMEEPTTSGNSLFDIINRIRFGQ